MLCYTVLLGMTSSFNYLWLLLHNIFNSILGHTSWTCFPIVKDSCEWEESSWEAYGMAPGVHLSTSYLLPLSLSQGAHFPLTVPQSEQKLSVFNLDFLQFPWLAISTSLYTYLSSCSLCWPNQDCGKCQRHLLSGNFPNGFSIIKVINLIGVVRHQIIMISFGYVLSRLYTCNEIHKGKLTYIWEANLLNFLCSR